MSEPTAHVPRTQDQAISHDMEHLGLWGKDVDTIPLIRTRYVLPFQKPFTPGNGVRLLFCTEDRAVRKVWIAC